MEQSVRVALAFLCYEASRQTALHPNPWIARPRVLVMGWQNEHQHNHGWPQCLPPRRLPLLVRRLKTLVLDRREGLTSDQMVAMNKILVVERAGGATKTLHFLDGCYFSTLAIHIPFGGVGGQPFPAKNWSNLKMTETTGAYLSEVPCMPACRQQPRKICTLCRVMVVSHSCFSKAGSSSPHCVFILADFVLRGHHLDWLPFVVPYATVQPNTTSQDMRAGFASNFPQTNSSRPSYR